jgi:hypothetical protein
MSLIATDDFEAGQGRGAADCGLAAGAVLD